MLIPFRTLLTGFALITGVIASYSVLAEEGPYDRLDGKGPSGKRVDVIEWEGNLEIHVYPKGSLYGLGAKLDDREKGKKVMVIGYRFDPKKKSKSLIRRAILGVPFHPQIKGYIDRTEKEFDKLALSNQGLSRPWEPYPLDPAPTQWYPEGHPGNHESARPDSTELPFLGSKSLQEQKLSPPGVDGGTVRGQQRAPASQIEDSDFEGEETDKKIQNRAQENEGRIKNFSW